MPTESGPEIDIVDSTWLGVRPTTLAAVLSEPANWRRWWPDLDLVVHEWRGVKGVRWTVRGARPPAMLRHVAPGALTGSMEVWLEGVDGGVVAHYFLRLSAATGSLRPRRRARIERTYRTRAKRLMWALGDELDPGRLARLAAPRAPSPRSPGTA